MAALPLILGAAVVILWRIAFSHRLGVEGRQYSATARFCRCFLVQSSSFGALP
jgi:hypothetical protein